MEEYLVGVVSAELTAGFHVQACRAQAVASRTYAWYQKQSAGTGRDWDLLATEVSQVYAGLTRENLVPEAARAVRDKRGLVCTWKSPQGEKIFCTYYCSSCGGVTQDAGPMKNEPSIPPLAGGVICHYCENAPTFRWGPVRVEKSVLTQRLRDK